MLSVDCEQSLILAMAIVGPAKYTGTREISRRREASMHDASVCASHEGVCISPAPQSPSPKLETTRSVCSVAFI